jgi:hypothetical protein
MKVRLLPAAAAVTLLAVACGSPTMPSTTPSVAGAWSGSSVDSQGTTVVTWTLAQAGTQVMGTVQTRAPDPTDGSCNACHRNKSGTFTGTITGQFLTMNLQFAAGVDGDPTPICSATMAGSAYMATAGQLSGAYTGSDTCEGSFLNGALAMTRR